MLMLLLCKTICGMWTEHNTWEAFFKKSERKCKWKQSSLRNDVLVSDAVKHSFKGNLYTFIFYIIHRLVWITCCTNWLH